MQRQAPNRIGPLRFVLVFGVVSMLGDVVYEGGRSVVAPLLEGLGASAGAVAWLAGSALVGALYGHSVAAAQTFVVVTQAVAIVAFAALVARRG
ncbi:MAG TPA: hypothetical protein VHB30_02310 [Solirubrobacteraceae bacterium]|nr:hypothetical protein [Solirubrobacteraceae bacterium]